MCRCAAATGTRPWPKQPGADKERPRQSGQNVFHIVEARLRAGCEPCRAQRATRENRPIRRPVGNLDPFGITIENDRMLAGDIAAAQHCKADIAGAACACLSLADHVGDIVELYAAATGRRLAKRQRGAGRRIDLVVMVGLQNLDIPSIDKLRGNLLDQLAEKGDADGCVRAIDKRDAVRRRAQRRLVLIGQAGRADDERGVA